MFAHNDKMIEMLKTVCKYEDVDMFSMVAGIVERELEPKYKLYTSAFNEIEKQAIADRYAIVEKVKDMVFNASSEKVAEFVSKIIKKKEGDGVHEAVEKQESNIVIEKSIKANTKKGKVNQIDDKYNLLKNQIRFECCLTKVKRVSPEYGSLSVDIPEYLNDSNGFMFIDVVTGRRLNIKYSHCKKQKIVVFDSSVYRPSSDRAEYDDLKINCELIVAKIPKTLNVVFGVYDKSWRVDVSRNKLFDGIKAPHGHNFKKREKYKVDIRNLYGESKLISNLTCSFTSGDNMHFDTNSNKRFLDCMSKNKNHKFLTIIVR